MLAPSQLGETSADAFGGAASGLALAVDGGAGVEGLDLAQLLQQRSFERQHRAATKHVGGGASALACAGGSTRRRPARVVGARGGVGLGQQRREVLLAGEDLRERVTQVGARVDAHPLARA